MTSAAGDDIENPATARARSSFGNQWEKIDDDSREETTLREAQEGAGDVELVGCVNAANEDGAEPPGQHDPENPEPGAPALDDQGSWDFEQDVAEKEDARVQAEDRL